MARGAQSLRSERDLKAIKDEVREAATEFCTRSGDGPQNGAMAVGECDPSFLAHSHCGTDESEQCIH